MMLENLSFCPGFGPLRVSVFQFGHLVTNSFSNDSLWTPEASWSDDFEVSRFHKLPK